MAIAKRPVFESLGDGISIGYRRNQGAGVWVARRSDGKGGKFERRLGLADDYADADGERVLTFAQASLKAHAFDPITEMAAPAPAAVVVTVRTALDAYERDIRTRNGDVGNVQRVRAHLPGAILDRPVAKLTVGELKAWRDDLAEKLAQSTVNRTATPLKAALNQAADADQGRTIPTRVAWEIGLATLADAEQSRNVVLPESEVAKVVAAAHAISPAFGLLVETAAVTGSRYSQLAALAVGDFQDGAAPRLMVPPSKKGKSGKTRQARPVPIGEGLARRFREAIAGRRQDDPLLARADGTRWEKSHHIRSFKKAVEAAKLDAKLVEPYDIGEVTIYALRHSSIVRQILRGVPLRVIAALHDTSVQMIERTYSSRIADHADAFARAALEDFSPAAAQPAAEREIAPEPMAGGCRHGHSYAEYPPYRNASGTVVCSECARARARRNRRARRHAAAPPIPSEFAGADK